MQRRPCALAAACLALLAFLLAPASGFQDVTLHVPGRELLAQCDQRNFKDLTATITPNPVVDLQWIDKNDQIVFAVTRKTGYDAGGLWYSTDGAKTWSDKTQQLNASITDPKEPIDVIGVFAQKSNSRNVVLFGSGTYIWVSGDSGATLAPRQTPTKWKGSGIKSLKLHPYKDDWLLLLVKRPSCKAMDHAVSECPFDLMLTQDLFSGNPNWQNLTEISDAKIAGFVDFDWGMNLCPKDRSKCPDHKNLVDSTIFATMYAHTGDYDQIWDPDVNFVVSSNNFKDFSTHVRCGNMFELVGHSVYLAFANLCPTDIHGNKRSQDPVNPRGITLYTSIDGGNEFVQACLPVALKQEGYELLETHDGSGAVIIVDFLISNGFMDIHASSVYTAGPHHALFSLSLTDVYNPSDAYSADFTKVEGLPGVYIANQMLPRADEVDDYYDLSDITGLPLVESRITFNGGGRWQRIPAPTTYNSQLCNRCDGQVQCYLHLHGMSSWDSMYSAVPAVYSNPSAPGFIMGTGNVGPLGVGLDDNDGLCTWLSTDGGVTWSDVGEGAYIYEYADWGGLIVMAQHPGMQSTPADEVRFSWDFGRCWQSVKLITALLVDNIRIEPDGQRPRVVVHGHACHKALNPKCSYSDNDTRGSPQGIMYLVDIADLMSGTLGLCGASDHELWSVPNEVSRTARCVLGQVTSIERRRPDVMCLNGADYQRPAPQYKPCNCTPDDLECDYGYVRSGLYGMHVGADCAKIVKQQMPTCPAIDSGQYSVSSTGQRLVHGDQCHDVHTVIPDTDGKGKKRPGADDDGDGGGERKKRSGFVSFLIFLLVVALLFGMFFGWWTYLATEGHKDLVRDVVSSAVSFFVSLYHWALDKIRGGRRSNMYEQDLGYFQPLGDAGVHDTEERGIFTLK